MPRGRGEVEYLRFNASGGEWHRGCCARVGSASMPSKRTFERRRDDLAEFLPSEVMSGTLVIHVDSLVGGVHGVVAQVRTDANQQRGSKMRAQKAAQRDERLSKQVLTRPATVFDTTGSAPEHHMFVIPPATPK